ncbi:unnamed protein product [Prorocentrum cordatum]|uniref:WW domain-containing protein n=1 Tax=Prorocentrum cordatum TaxID=2364126 RepID=A0ABN9Y9M1_9DINO|nr:unnamed protein product [Polarella glacialis]
MDEEPRAETLQVADLEEYSRILGVEGDVSADADLLWVVQEAFNAPLPLGWSEHKDDEERVYFFHEASNASTWEHPMDAVYRELIGLVLRVRSEVDLGAEPATVVHGHLREVHQRALKGLEHWSGPYAAPDGGEYYYNKVLKVSSWECPVHEWEQELTVRLGVLCRCLLPPGARLAVDKDGSVGVSVQDDGGAAGATGPALLAALKLPLGLVRRDVGKDGQPDTPATDRSFHTARSHCSSRRSYRDGPRDPAHSPSTSAGTRASAVSAVGTPAPPVREVGVLREMD